MSSGKCCIAGSTKPRRSMRQKIKDEIEKRKEMLRDADKRAHRTSTSQENNPSEKDNNGHGDAPELNCNFPREKKIGVREKGKVTEKAIPRW
ncbi:unnamed protein product [Diatraea saccharalis]|uniref:Uncharacterized protein n=1 Tax=Diatraea saccharalis TaxID=40085 RepID=A0A9N9WCT3_9NEOP|nr:unnamed protein product [Diatraea saccharalis]